MLSCSAARLSQVTRGLQVQRAAHLRHRQRHLLQPVREGAGRPLAAFPVAEDTERAH